MKLDKVAAQFARFISNETHKLITDYSTQYGKGFTQIIMNKFLSTTIEALILDALKKDQNKDLTAVQASKLAEKNFAEIKFNIQESVAKGFEMGMYKFANKGIPYYCLIKPVPPPVNKEMC